MRRTLVYGTAAALLTVALVLTLVGWGEEATAFPDWQALDPRPRPGIHRAAADLVVGAPDPRPVARRLDVSEGARGVQQDVRRRASPRHAGRRRRVLLARPDRVPGGVVPQPAAACDRDRRREDRLDHRRRDHPGGAHRRRLSERDRGAAREAVADRDPARGLRPRPLLGRPATRAEGDRGHEPAAGPPRRPRPERCARTRRLAIGHHDQRGPVPRPDARCGGAPVVPAPRPDRARCGRC